MSKQDQVDIDRVLSTSLEKEKTAPIPPRLQELAKQLKEALAQSRRGK